MDPVSPAWGEVEDVKSVSRGLLPLEALFSLLTNLQMTLMHNLIESSRESSYWTPDLLIQAIIGIWFAASHQPWIVRSRLHHKRNIHANQQQNLHFMFLELCTRPSYIQLLRSEIDAQESLDYAHISKMPIVDSFMKESVRLNPLDTSTSFARSLTHNIYGH